SLRNYSDDRKGKCDFFFSSRRRHTSSKRDWSSDVCSSDLLSLAFPPPLLTLSTRRRTAREARARYASVRLSVRPVLCRQLLTERRSDGEISALPRSSSPSVL